jgi:hypothetical protein
VHSSVRHDTLRRLTVMLAAASVAAGAAIYLQVSGVFAAVGLLAADVQAGDNGDRNGQGPDGQGIQPPANNPSAGFGQPIARTGGS